MAVLVVVGTDFLRWNRSSSCARSISSAPRVSILVLKFALDLGLLIVPPSVPANLVIAVFNYQVDVCGCYKHT